MSLLPILAAREVLRRLLKAGFKIQNQKGSHIKLFHPLSGHRTGIPLHPGDLSRNLTREIIKQAGLSLENFLEL